MVNNITVPPITPDIRIPCSYAERDQWLDAISKIGEENQVSRLDGVRIEFPDGWLLARKSVTEEGITIRIEGMNQDVIKRIKNQLISVLPPLKSYLSDR
mgnify:FL=1